MTLTESIIIFCNQYVNIFQSYFLFYFFLSVPRSMWDLSSLTRVWTRACYVEVQSPNHWIGREFLTFSSSLSISDAHFSKIAFQSEFRNWMQILFLCLSIFIVLCSLVYHILIGLPRWLSGKESACQCRRLEFDPGLRISLGKGNGNPLQYSCLENPMDGGA